ncbi:methyltransferase family protein [Quadrisphaera sp. GCM10027208]|uniref:methyltransferase family protein n=1 Tax=Quadrisphaera sp. GCM10027208 TaxID=3273423 RepID=UPI00362052F7
MDSRYPLVASQFTALAVLAWPGRPRWRLPAAAAAGAGVLTAAGGELAEAGARAQGRQLSPWIAPPRQGRLLTSGPYAVSRNPIYAGLLVGGLGVAVLRRRVRPLAAWTSLAVVLHVKSGKEEQALLERFGAEYEAYRRRVPRLLGVPPR